MPELDGLKVVEEVKRRWPAVPVVLMTSRGNEEIASEALKRGAAGYVSKARLEKDLGHTVHNLLNIAASRADFGYVMGSMTKVKFSLVMDNDWKRVNTFVKFFQEGVGHMGLFDQTDRTRLGVALTEALLNRNLPRQPGREFRTSRRRSGASFSTRSNADLTRRPTPAAECSLMRAGLPMSANS